MAYCFSLLGDEYQTIIKAVGSNGPGTYRLRLWTAERSGSFSPIGRMIGADPEGVLYIGTGKFVISRTDLLKHAVGNAYRLHNFKAYKEHTCARAMEKQFCKTFDHKRLCIEVSPLEPEAVDDHYQREWKLLTDYFQRFGEFPPLNGIKPSRDGTLEPASFD